ncbi:MAG: ferredoxin--NADP reductase, partial [Pseudomonadota bacterium]
MESTPDTKSTKALPLQQVTAIRHWNDRLFSFRVTRPDSLRFRSGEFTMIGLPDANAGKPLQRAYSIASPAWDEELEFYSIKVPDGPLTSKLKNIRIGDQIVVQSKPVGSLVLDALLPGKRLYMFATGTGIAPFASLIRDPELYQRFDQIILTHTCRQLEELGYSQDLMKHLPNDPLVGEYVPNAVRYYPSITQEDFTPRGRITDLLESGRLFRDLNIEPLSAYTDRVMICGSLG